jgi:hypothetical protein
MNELTARDIDRLSREMVKRFHEVAARDGYDAAAEMGRIMGEYPPAVGFAYLMLALDQLVSGDAVIASTGRKGRR